jgi:cytochrome c553
MVNVGGAVIEFPTPSTAGTTGIVIEPGNMTYQDYLDANAAKNGPGYETCAACHGPGGQADVKVMHNLN